jgi:hypothetical protein
VVKNNSFLKIFRGSFRAAKFLRSMLSIVLRRILLEFGPKKIFGGAFEAICYVVSIVIFLNTLIYALSVYMKFEKVPSKHSEHTHKEMMLALSY